MNKTRMMFVAACIFLFIILSEAIYVFNHRDVLSAYLLKSARFVSGTGNIPSAIFILTEGRIKLPKYNDFEPQFKSYFASLPKDYNLARANYDLAILTSKTNLELTEKFLLTSVNSNPHLGFWSLELANFYLSQNKFDIGAQVLDDCQKVYAPQRQCREYFESLYKSKHVQEIGFMNEQAKAYYDAGLP